LLKLVLMPPLLPLKQVPLLPTKLLLLQLPLPMPLLQTSLPLVEPLRKKQLRPLKLQPLPPNKLLKLQVPILHRQLKLLIQPLK
jgi:hypothetical protein